MFVTACGRDEHPDRFESRHIGPDEAAVRQMVQACGCESLDDLIQAVVPGNIRSPRPLNLPAPASEFEALARLRGIAGRNQVFRSNLGMGYYDCIVPPVIQRNILENPGWYTQYTPYQAEIAQGRLEGLLNFQTMVSDLTGLEIANASLLDEATAAAEAMHLAHAMKAGENRSVFFVAHDCHPQTLDVVRTRAQPLGIQVVVGDFRNFTFDAKVFGALVQYPATDGAIYDFREFSKAAHDAGALLIVATDLLALTLLTPPGEFGADIALGSAQRFGVPLGFGGPHAAFFAVREACKRLLPGRLVGVSKDSRGRPALRLSLQTREQHIRRERATSNICTAQALLANMAAMYAVYHGPDGLRKIAARILRLTRSLAARLKHHGFATTSENYFDTLKIPLGDCSATEIVRLAEARRINLRVYDQHHLGISLDETTTTEDVEELVQIFAAARDPHTAGRKAETALASPPPALDPAFTRTSAYLTHPVFNRYHSETEMLRYLRRLESRDLSLTTSMIPLGSCTMKLNATSEMFPVSWPEFACLHPFAPASQTEGYAILFNQLESWIKEITGFAAVSLQPNSGAQGEFAGLLAIRACHESRGESQRNVCLIPTSAHGTNPASAVLAGFKVVAVACDADGNIDVPDLRAKAQANAAALGALMITYPSTHGVFEESIRDICDLIHTHGGQVYMDGANLNAQVGLCRPADMGADVCHLNLHKTFCIPHGGGGPGMGPIGVAQHLAPFLPGHAVVKLGEGRGAGAVSAAPWGSAGILPISWMYIAAMGAAGLTQATKIAILNANYIARRLAEFFPILYKGARGFVAHECILDLRHFKTVTVEDVAKRLMDYGFHAPTISWPVPGTIMVEPTESESKEELDRFCDAMIGIHGEIKAIESGQANSKDNLLKNAPHTADMVTATEWNRPYTREQAAYPAPWLRDHKFWPAVGRIDNVFGDRNLVCSCAGMDAHS